MQFWRGNKLDAGFSQPVDAVSDAFCAQYEPADEPLERSLRRWLTDPAGFDATWEAETGEESFEELFELVRAKVYRRGDPDYSVNHVT